MASNPIQKKVRNAGLVGAAITLVIMSIIVAFLLIQLNKIKEEQKVIETSYRTVYKLNQNVESGDVITADMLEMSTAQIQHIPASAPSTANMLVEFENQSLTDEQGNSVLTDPIGAFLAIDSAYTEIYEDENGYYTYSKMGQKETVTGIDKDDIYTDEATGDRFIVKKTNKTRLYYEEDEYYILKLKYSDNKPQRVRENIKIFGVPLIAKIDMDKNTVLTMDMVSKGSPISDGVRKQEYNAIVLPTDLTTGDYIDIRVQLPTGQDFIVLSKKMVEIPVIDGIDSETTIWLKLSEDEILSMSCAIVESYRINGSKLYATKYAEPGRQEAAIPTYPISAETRDLILADPNVTQKAEQELINRYSQELIDIRNNKINNELSKPENSSSNVTEKINASIAETQAERKKYLQSIAGY